MRELVTITDLTRMQGQRVCLAGYLSYGLCVRPVLRTGELTEAWLYAEDGQVMVQPFAVVELDLQEAKAHPPHSEDWYIDPDHRRSRKVLRPEQRQIWLARIDDGSIANIFGATIHQGPGWYIMAREGKRSLGAISPRQIEEVSFTLKEADKWDYRLAFTDSAGQPYRLAVTDLAFRYFLDWERIRAHRSPTEAARHLTATLQQAQVFLRIGLARGWAKFPDRCYLQITGVYSFPDYLTGRCFADLTLSTEELEARE